MPTTGKCKPGKKKALVVTVLDPDEGIDDYRIVESLSTCGLETKLRKLFSDLVPDFMKRVNGAGDFDVTDNDIDDLLTEEPFCPSRIAGAGFIQVKFLN